MVFARARGDQELVDDAAELAAKIADARFNLVVLGEFKRGKSTFINALLGKPLLPTAVVPLTSVVTVVRYAEEPAATVIFLDNKSADIGLSSVADYMTETGNPDNRRGVKTVEIGFPSDFLRGGVRIVDTPGTGSVHEHNTQATLDYLPEADALIFLLTADQPASREELDLLHEASTFAPRFFVVQNKIDYLDEDQRSESMDFLQRTLGRELEGQIRIYPISAKAALGGRFEQAGEFGSLWDDIHRFLLEERTDVLAENVAARLGRLLDGASASIQLESSMAEMSADSIQTKIDAFRRSAELIASTQREADHLLQADIDDLMVRIDADLKSFAKSRREKAVAQIKSALETNLHLNNFRLVGVLKGVVRQQVEAAFNEWRAREENVLAAAFENIAQKFAVRANQIVDDIGRLTKEIFGVEMASHFEVEPLTTRSSLYYYIEDPFDYQFSQFWLLLPRFVVGNRIRRIFVRSMEYELSRNAARLRGDLKDRLDESGRAFLSRFRAQVSGVTDEVDKALSATAARLNHAKARGEKIAERNAADAAAIAELQRQLARGFTDPNS